MATPATTPTFPAGLRVLVVDDDPLCLRIVDKMLKRCQYVGECVLAAGGIPKKKKKVLNG